MRPFLPKIPRMKRTPPLSGVGTDCDREKSQRDSAARLVIVQFMWAVLSAGHKRGWRERWQGSLNPGRKGRSPGGDGVPCTHSTHPSDKRNSFNFLSVLWVGTEEHGVCVSVCKRWVCYPCVYSACLIYVCSRFICCLVIFPAIWVPNPTCNRVDYKLDAVTLSAAVCPLEKATHFGICRLLRQKQLTSSNSGIT